MTQEERIYNAVQMYQADPSQFNDEQVRALAMMAAESGIPFEPKFSMRRGLGHAIDEFAFGLIPGMPEPMTQGEATMGSIGGLLSLVTGIGAAGGASRAVVKALQGGALSRGAAKYGAKAVSKAALKGEKAAEAVTAATARAEAAMKALEGALARPVVNRALGTGLRFGIGGGAVEGLRGIGNEELGPVAGALSGASSGMGMGLLGAALGAGASPSVLAMMKAHPLATAGGGALLGSSMLY
jgi:hypothetical protein